MEIDKEFERERQEQSTQLSRVVRCQAIEDVIMNNVFGSNDVVVHEESQPSQENNFPTSEEARLVINDDDDIDHPHSFDEDNKEDGIPLVTEMKPIIPPSGIVVKV
jgi:hypothetical protein